MTYGLALLVCNPPAPLKSAVVNPRCWLFHVLCCSTCLLLLSANTNTRALGTWGAGGRGEAAAAAAAAPLQYIALSKAYGLKQTSTVSQIVCP